MTTFVSEELATWAVQHRRYLHQHPELSGVEYETCKYIRQQLLDLEIEVLDCEGPNVIGYLKGTSGVKTIALRADIDALPIPEEGDKPYMSTVPGVAHLCGHDGHTAILLATAKWISEHRNEVKPNVLFIFQSSEEASPSGAESLVKQNILENVDAIFGLHLIQEIEKGKIGVCYGPLNAGTDDFEITITGSGGHGAYPHTATDPIYISSFILQALQGIVSRRVDPLHPAVITVGKISSGTTYNVIPNQATLVGTIRTLSHQVREQILSEVKTVVEGICNSFGASAEVTFILGTPPLVNDLQMTEYAERVVKGHFPEDIGIRIPPTMGGEDFSFYLEEKPGSYLNVGMNSERSAYPHHHPKFDIDEDVFPTAIELFVQLVLNFEE